MCFVQYCEALILRKSKWSYKIYDIFVRSCIVSITIISLLSSAILLYLLQLRLFSIHSREFSNTTSCHTLRFWLRDGHEIRCILVIPVFMVPDVLYIQSEYQDSVYEFHSKIKGVKVSNLDFQFLKYRYFLSKNLFTRNDTWYFHVD